MSLTGDESRDDGHTILLIETNSDERTFKFFNTQHDCLMALIDMFETTSEDHAISLFFRWIDDFRQLKMFTLDRSITRYRVRSGATLKDLYEEVGNEGQYRPSQNGGENNLGSEGSMRSCSLELDDHREQEMDLSDGNDDWQE